VNQGRKTTPDKRRLIRLLHERGFKTREIAERCNLSTWTVRRFLAFIGAAK
jgi:DNA-directed RNA polymerase specialized sigma24 family protein